MFPSVLLFDLNNQLMTLIQAYVEELRTLLLVDDVKLKFKSSCINSLTANLIFLHFRCIAKSNMVPHAD